MSSIIDGPRTRKDGYTFAAYRASLKDWKAQSCRDSYSQSGKLLWPSPSFGAISQAHWVRDERLYVASLLVVSQAYQVSQNPFSIIDLGWTFADYIAYTKIVQFFSYIVHAKHPSAIIKLHTSTDCVLLWKLFSLLFTFVLISGFKGNAHKRVCLVYCKPYYYGTW